MKMIVQDAAMDLFGSFVDLINAANKATQIISKIPTPNLPANKTLFTAFAVSEKLVAFVATAVMS